MPVRMNLLTTLSLTVTLSRSARKLRATLLRSTLTDNQQVKAGDLIVELDARDYQTRLQQAKAALDAGLAKQNEARTNVTLTRATGAASIQQALRHGAAGTFKR